jgi:hypothetical protein
MGNAASMPTHVETIVETNPAPSQIASNISERRHPEGTRVADGAKGLHRKTYEKRGFRHRTSLWRMVVDSLLVPSQ